VTWRRVALVLRKEGMESLRDRRTLFVTLVLPMLLYPGLMIGLGTAMTRQQGKLREATQKMAFEGPVPAALREALRGEKGLVTAEPANAEAALRAGEVQLVVRAAAGFEETLAAGGTAKLELLHDSANEASAEARRKAREVVDKYREGILSARLAARSIPPAYIEPVDVPSTGASDVASPAKRGAHIFGRMLSMMLVIMVITGAFSPAVDTVAGEKERGTMETLLVCPATRLEIVLGKFLAVLAVSIATAIGNLVSMGLTFGQFAGMLGARQKIDFHLDFGTAATVFAVLLPMAALFAAVALALSTLARSTKEAQTYLTPLMLLAMPVSMVGMIPNVELTFGLAAVPVAGAVLLFRDLMLAQGEPALLAKVGPLVPVVFGTTALAAGLAIRWAVWMFGREEVLFRDAGEAFSWKDLRPVRRAGSIPGPGGAVFLPAAALALNYFLGMALVTPANMGSPWVVALTQGILLVAVAGAIGLARMDPGATLGLRRPAPLPLAAAVLVGAGFSLGTPWLSRVAGLAPEEGTQTAKILEQLVLGLPGYALVLLLGVLPAVAEESLFRGWTLRGLRSQMSGFAAVVLSAVMFGAFHLEPERIAFTGALGLALGFLALRSGSLWPGVLAHALFNGTTVVLAKATTEAGGATGTPATILTGESAAWGLGGLAAAAAGIALAWAATRPARDSLPATAPSR
jgi:sodium transport system permease protein